MLVKDVLTVLNKTQTGTFLLWFSMWTGEMTYKQNELKTMDIKAWRGLIHPELPPKNDSNSLRIAIDNKTHEHFVHTTTTVSAMACCCSEAVSLKIEASLRYVYEKPWHQRAPPVPAMLFVSLMNEIVKVREVGMGEGGCWASFDWHSCTQRPGTINGAT